MSAGVLQWWLGLAAWCQKAAVALVKLSKPSKQCKQWHGNKPNGH